MNFATNDWALILGGSSGFGLASAKKLASLGMNVCLVHRDLRGAMPRIEPEFESIRAMGHRLVALNLDALSEEGLQRTLAALKSRREVAYRLAVTLLIDTPLGAFRFPLTKDGCVQAFPPSVHACSEQR